MARTIDRRVVADVRRFAPLIRRVGSVVARRGCVAVIQRRLRVAVAQVVRAVVVIAIRPVVPFPVTAPVFIGILRDGP